MRPTPAAEPAAATPAPARGPEVMPVLPSRAFDETLTLFAGAVAPFGAPMDGIPRLRDDGDAAYGLREFHVVDPSGSLLRVGAPVGGA